MTPEEFITAGHRLVGPDRGWQVRLAELINARTGRSLTRNHICAYAANRRTVSAELAGQIASLLAELVGGGLDAGDIEAMGAAVARRLAKRDLAQGLALQLAGAETDEEVTARLTAAGVLQRVGEVLEVKLAQIKGGNDVSLELLEYVQVVQEAMRQARAVAVGGGKA